jgi:hypothetical protein
VHERSGETLDALRRKKLKELSKAKLREAEDTSG